MEIIKYINPKTEETGSAIQMFEEEKNSIQEVCTLLECFKKNISDGRDLYEFDFCQKFLKSLTTLSDLSEISGKIDELVFESIPDMVSFYGNEPARPKVEDKEITERLNELKNIIDMFNGLNQKPKKPRKKKKTDDELYEQLRMDLENQERKEERRDKRR